MHPPIIDTLGLATRLKNGGVDPSNADTIARVMGDELTERMVAKRDFVEFEARIRADIGVLTEGVEAVDAKLDVLRAELTSESASEFEAVRGEMAAEFEAVRGETAAEFEAVRGEMAAEFEAVRGEMAAEFEAVRGEMAAEFEAVRGEMTAEFKAVRGEMAAEFKAVRGEMAAEFKVVRGEMAAGFKAVGAKFEVVDAKFEAVDAKIEALGNRIATQGRFVFLILAILAALGIFNATTPYMLRNELRQALSAPQLAVAQPAPRDSAAAGAPSQSETGQRQDASTTEPTLHR